MAAHNATKACSPKASTGVEICLEHTAMMKLMRSASQLEQPSLAEAEDVIRRLCGRGTKNSEPKEKI